MTESGKQLILAAPYFAKETVSGSCSYADTFRQGTYATQRRSTAFFMCIQICIVRVQVEAEQGWSLVLAVVSSGWCWTRDQTRTEWQVGRHCKYTSNNPDFHHATQLGHQGYPQISQRYIKILIQTPLSTQKVSVTSEDPVHDWVSEVR